MGKTGKVGDNVFILSHWEGQQHFASLADIDSPSAKCHVVVWNRNLKAQKLIKCSPERPG